MVYDISALGNWYTKGSDASGECQSGLCDKDKALQENSGGHR